MLTYKAFRAPGMHLTTVGTRHGCYVVIFEGDVALGRLWRRKYSEPGEPEVWGVTRVPVIGTVSPGRVPWMPSEYEGLPQCRIRGYGYFGGNVVTLPDGRRCSLPLRSGGYLDGVEGPMDVARHEPGDIAACGSTVI